MSRTRRLAFLSQLCLFLGVLLLTWGLGGWIAELLGWR